jgi:hypothetical protein
MYSSIAALSIIAESAFSSPLKVPTSCCGTADGAIVGGFMATTPLTRSGRDDRFTLKATDIAIFAPAD